MSLDAVLAGLDKVRGSNGRYQACCPAHDDKSPSLAVAEVDGKVLLHCFGGCAVDDIVAALGLDMIDLFPPSSLQKSASRLHAIQKSHEEVTEALHHELIVLTMIVGGRIADRKLARDRKFREARPEWRPRPHEHWDREIKAAGRIRTALEALYG